MEELSLKEVSHRLARFLRDRAQRFGVRTRRGVEFRLEETNQKIGAEIGTVRDLVSRNLRRYVDQGHYQDGAAPGDRARYGRARSAGGGQQAGGRKRGVTR